MKNHLLRQFALVVVVLIAVNFISGSLYKRFDLTQDKRYTLSDSTKDIIENIESPLIIDVLLDGSFPAEFKKLQLETRQLLEEFNAYNPNIKFSFVNPLEEEQNSDEIIVQLSQLGLQPASVTVEENGKISQEVIFPWAMANLKEQTVRIPLLKNKLGSSNEELVNNSIQQLEYAFADAFSKLSTEQKKTIAIIKGNNELENIYITDFVNSLQEHYRVAPYTLDSVSANAQKTLDDLKNFDLAIIAKPTERFTDSEKYVLDQYTISGGKSIWLIDQVSIEMDSLRTNGGKSYAYPRDLNLSDLFFKYGVRINPVLLNDIYCAQIVVASGNGDASQFSPVPWLFDPMVFSANNHPINTNIEALRFQFTNPIDTLANDVKKSILLSSSNATKIIGSPSEVNFDIITRPPEKESFNAGKKNLAVLLEGAFTSVYKNRIKPIKLDNVSDEGVPSKIIVISDGDLIKNQVTNGVPEILGFDKWTGNSFGNKEFLLNSVNYLLDDNGLINIRAKKISIPFLDREKVVSEKGKWQLINLIFPLVVLLILTGGLNMLRKRRFSKR